jgi:hypothetical protein
MRCCAVREGLIEGIIFSHSAYSIYVIPGAALVERPGDLMRLNCTL